MSKQLPQCAVCNDGTPSNATVTANGRTLYVCSEHGEAMARVAERSGQYVERTSGPLPNQPAARRKPRRKKPTTAAPVRQSSSNGCLYQLLAAGVITVAIVALLLLATGGLR